MLFSFDCENSFAAHSAFYFLEYWLKWLFKCKRLPTPALGLMYFRAMSYLDMTKNKVTKVKQLGIYIYSSLTR